MTMHVTYSQVTEVKVHQFVAEASGLGLRAGQWPKEIQTDMGNKQPLFPISKVVRDGDIVYVRYGQGNGCLTIKIYND
jgi:hypothetical protein